MSDMLRIILIVASLATFISLINRIRRSKLRIDDAIFWVFFSIMLVTVAVFPRIVYILSDIIGMQSPANMVYLIIIFLLIMKIFAMSLHMSIMEEKLYKLVQDMALKEHRHNPNQDKATPGVSGEDIFSTHADMKEGVCGESEYRDKDKEKLDE